MPKIINNPLTMLVIKFELRIEKLRKSKASNEFIQCEVSGCENKSKRSLSSKKVRKALPNLKFEKSGNKVHLCKEHYKEFKKATKTDRRIETLTWD